MPTVARIVVLAVLAAQLGFAQSQPLPPNGPTRGELTWKVPVRRSTISPTAPADGLAAGRHQIIYLEAPPGRAEVDRLEALGYRVLGQVPGNGVLVIPAKQTRRVASDAAGPAAPPTLESVGVQSIASFDPAQKISPEIDLNGRDPFYVVEFHPDVDLNVARTVVLSDGLQLRDNPDVGPHRLLVRRRISRRASNPLPLLALHDEVAYIFPASDALIRGIPTMQCGGAITELGTIGQYIASIGDGWDGPGQGAATLGYHFDAMTAKLPAALAKSEIERAMAEWAKVAAVDWQAVSQAGSLRTVSFLFATGAHGDAYPFDGPGNTLAHTFYPAPPNPEPLAGDVHLDDAENWRVGANTDLFSVVLHELGHALGLGHSDNPNDVMYPYYRISSTLSDGDRTAILRLYAPAGTQPNNPQTPGPTAPTGPNPTDPKPTDPNPTDPGNPDTPTSGGGNVTPIPGDTTIPTITVLSPGNTSASTSLAEFTVKGTASDPSGIASVTWTNLGRNGSATLTTASDGTVHWRASIPLLTGINRITLRATDGAGTTAFRSVVVLRF